MTAIKFCKFHGFGNDYIVIEREEISASISLSELAVSICHRNTGVGGDGIAVLKKSAVAAADYFCEIVNPDGSVAGFSGNGTRCAVSYLYYKSRWSDDNLRLETRSGVKNYRLIEQMSPGHYIFEAGIGKPKFASDEVPVQVAPKRDAVVNEMITVAGKQYLFSAVNIGNPVACIFVDSFNFDWRSTGREMETHEVFPDRANIVFVKVKDRENIELRIWERGAGETSASGTCSSGAAVLSAFLLKTGREINVHSEGGVTRVIWNKDDEIIITGRADLAFCGEWPA